MSRDVWSREVFTTTVSEQPKDHLGLNSKAEEEEVKVKVFTFKKIAVRKPCSELCLLIQDFARVRSHKVRAM